MKLIAILIALATMAGCSTTPPQIPVAEKQAPQVIVVERVVERVVEQPAAPVIYRNYEIHHYPRGPKPHDVYIAPAYGFTTQPRAYWGY